MCAKFRFSISSCCDDIVAKVKGVTLCPPPPPAGGWRGGPATAGLIDNTVNNNNLPRSLKGTVRKYIQYTVYCVMYTGGAVTRPVPVRHLPPNRQCHLADGRTVGPTAQWVAPPITWVEPVSDIISELTSLLSCSNTNSKNIFSESSNIPIYVCTSDTMQNNPIIRGNQRFDTGMSVFLISLNKNIKKTVFKILRGRTYNSPAAAGSPRHPPAAFLPLTYNGVVAKFTWL